MLEDPPLVLARPVKVRGGALPKPPAGSVIWQLKHDGHRITVWRTKAGVALRSKTGRDVTRAFPEIIEPLESLPAAGTVLDGELTATRLDDHAPDFTALSRLPAWRRAHRVALSYVAFDMIASGGVDQRPRPLAERWPALLDLLDAAPTGLGTVLATLDRSEALRWLDAVRGHGVEGLVMKPLSAAYGPDAGWVKWRVSDTLTAEVIGVLGPGRPRALRVEIEDGRQAVTEPLTEAGSRAIRRGLEESGLPLRVEVRAGTGRHAQVRFIRLRPPD